MPDPNRITELYLRMLFEDDQLWKAVVSIYPNPNDANNPFTPHAAAQSVDDLVKCIAARRTRRANNTYVCMSSLREPKSEVNRDGYPKISRTVRNAVSLKAHYVDVDVGKNNCYATTADAELGLRKFLTDSGMPDPSMQVYTGSGGFHCYWCMDEQVPVAEWQATAEALKACAKQHGFLIDPAITADPVRILRVPTTFNHKWDPPTECQLNLTSSFNVYPRAVIEQALEKFRSPAKQASSGPAPGLSQAAQNFTAGVGDALPPVPIDTLALVCPATADILARSGKGDSEPLWNLALLAASFTTDPKDAAHRLSAGYDQYDPVKTDIKLQEKLNARKANPKLGWPSCAQFNALHPACAGCQYFKQGKTPFHFVPRHTTQSPAPKATHDPLMPDGYWRNANDHVFTQSEHGPVDVLGYPILDGGINPETNLLAVKFSVSGRVHWGEIDMALQTPQKVAEAWTRGTINRIIIRDAKHIKGFTVSWIHHLQASKIERRAEGFGWHGDDFVYGDIRFTPTGRETAYRGSTANKVFSAKGELKPWQDTLVLVRGNIPLEIAVVSAFAAPLVKLVASNSAVLSIFSHESGRGKTTSLQIGQAVWGDPFIGMSSLEDTINAVGKKMEILRHLPIYWDELKTTEQVERIVNIIFQTTGSKSKARLRADASSAPVNAFTTLFAVASNHGVAGPVIRATSGSDAGGIRVFEIEADQPIGDAISIYDSNQLIKKLDDNHGVAGAIYAEYIVNNKPRCEAITKGIAAHLEQAFQFEKRERMWLNTMTTIVAGAMIAKECRLIDFDVDAIFAYLTRKFSGLRASRTAQSYSMLNMPAADWLAEMQRDLVGVNMVITDTVPRPVPGRRWSPLTNVGNFGVVDMNRLKHVWVQVGRNDDCWLISQKPFDQWVFDHGYSSEQVLALIRKDYNVAYHKATVGAGIAFLGDLKQTPCLYLSPKLKPKP